MLMVNVNSEVKKEFPLDLVRSCQANKNGIVRPMKAVNCESAIQGGAVHDLDAIKTPTLFEVENPQSGVLYDTFDIRTFEMNATLNNGLLNSYVSLTAPASKITLSADIIHTLDQKILASINPIATQNSNYLELNQSFTLDSSISGSDLAALVYANWTNPDGTDEELSMLYELNHKDEMLEYEHQRPSTNDHGVVIGSPLDMTYDETIKADNDSDHIVIALYRKPDDVSEVNYICGFGNLDGQPYLGIPAKGIFSMPSNYVPCVSGSNAPSATCILGPKSGGGKSVAQIIPEYQSDCDDMLFSAVGNELHYDMAYNWGIVYDGPANWVKCEFDYELRLRVAFQNTQNGSIKTYQPRITSIISDTGATEIIKPLYIMYGCLAAETLINMADGSSEEIRNIAIGDDILGADGEAWLVKNVWRGYEEILIWVEAGGLRIGLTLNHPMIAFEGIVRASAIKIGMKLLMDNGEYEEVTSVEIQEYQNDVFNLDIVSKDDAITALPEKHLMLANGFVVGDNVLQNHMEE